MVGLRCGTQAIFSCSKWGLLSIVVCRLLVVASLVEHRLWALRLQSLEHTGLVVAVHGP